MSFETLCTKSFLMLAIFECSLAILPLAFRQFFENFSLAVHATLQLRQFGQELFQGLALLYDFAIRERYEVDYTPVQPDC